jgi:16S rRNA processing protein RimM
VGKIIGVTDAPTQPAEEPVVLGRISGLFGVKGWVKVFSHTEPREAVLNYGHWLINRSGEWQSAAVAEGKRHSKTVIVRLEGIDDRDLAAELIGCDIGVTRSELPKPEAGRYYFRDLEGLKVVHRDGTDLGTVAYVMETGANDVLVTQGERERLIPFIADEVILDVDLANRVINVDWEWD